MKVLLANKFYYRRGGDCIYTMNVEQMLKEHGHQVAVFSMQHPENAASPSAIGASLGWVVIVMTASSASSGSAGGSSSFSGIGISSQQYFCRLFKKETGMSPQEYRKSYALTCEYDPNFYPAPIIGSDPEKGDGEA